MVLQFTYYYIYLRVLVSCQLCLCEKWTEKYSLCTCNVFSFVSPPGSNPIVRAHMIQMGEIFESSPQSHRRSRRWRAGHPSRARGRSDKKAETCRSRRSKWERNSREASFEGTELRSHTSSHPTHNKSEIAEKTKRKKPKKKNTRQVRWQP